LYKRPCEGASEKSVIPDGLRVREEMKKVWFRPRQGAAIFLSWGFNSTISKAAAPELVVPLRSTGIEVFLFHFQGVRKGRS
jgi:hypothetical protein